MASPGPCHKGDCRRSMIFPRAVSGGASGNTGLEGGAQEVAEGPLQVAVSDLGVIGRVGIQAQGKDFVSRRDSPWCCKWQIPSFCRWMRLHARTHRISFVRSPTEAHVDRKLTDKPVTVDSATRSHSHAESETANAQAQRAARGCRGREREASGRRHSQPYRGGGPRDTVHAEPQSAAVLRRRLKSSG